MPTLKTGPGSSSCGILGVLSDLEDDPLVLVVCAPYTTLVLEPRASCLGGRVDSPFIGGESSCTVPLSTRVAIACLNNCLVLKGHTGALFLLSAIDVVALIVDLPDMKRVRSV